MKALLEVCFSHRTRGFRGIGVSAFSPGATTCIVLLACQLASGQTYPRVWQQVFPSVAPPTRNAALAYDEARRVTVSYGGWNDGSGPVAGTWLWDGQTWTKTNAAGPGARADYAIVFDSRRQVCVLFGGGNEYGVSLQDTWEWDGAQWHLRATNGPPTSVSAAMAYDRSRGRTVLFGGLSCGLCNPNLPDTWEWDGTHWELAAASGPSGRSGHTMAFDERRGKVVLFGGRDDRGHDLDDTWLWDGQVWAQANVPGPTGRDGFGMAWDADRGTIVLFGGEGPSGYLSDTWEWNGSAWTLRLVLVPSGRTAEAFAYDRHRRQFVQHGGRNVPGGIQETWILKFVETWVDYAFIGLPNGTFAQPFPRLAAATNAAPAGSDIAFKPGSGIEEMTVRKALTLRAPLGNVIIRSP